MCSSMEDRNPHLTKPHNLNSELPKVHHPNPGKLVHRFLYKATIVTIFLVILPLLPSILPEFINENIHSTSWELLQLVFVGIAVSYGLFSKKNEGSVDKEHHYSLLDNANSYVTRLLQVSSIFDDEAENPSVSDDHKLQTWSSQYHRGEPIVMVAKELEEKNAVSSRIHEKPLLLPVRSLKSRVSEFNAVESSLLSRSDSKNSGSKRFAGSSRRSTDGDAVRVSPEKLEEKIVHPSPIPWRSWSGRMEMKVDDEDSSPSHPLFSSPPPAPPPPPPSYLHKPPPMKSKSGLSKYSDFHQMDLKNRVRSVSNDRSPSQSPGVTPQNSGIAVSRKANSGPELRPRTQGDIPLQGKSVRTIRPKSMEFNDNIIAGEAEGTSAERQGGLMEKLMQERMPDFKKESLMEYPREKKRGFIENMLAVESDVGAESGSEVDYVEESLGSIGSACDREEVADDNGANEEGPDVDKKADEFIAKFREQIRLQRIESIRRSTEQHSRNHSQ